MLGLKVSSEILKTETIYDDFQEAGRQEAVKHLYELKVYVMR